MSKIKNTAKISSELINVNRAQIEHRATWMGLIFDEAEKAGLDGEGLARKAIKRCGSIHGEGLKAACAEPNNCKDFRNVFLSEIVTKTFEMDNIHASYNDLGVEFHYCALVHAWQKLGFDDERCAKLCDIAMEGDRGIAEAMGLNLELTDTIAKGCPACKLRFHK